MTLLIETKMLVEKEKFYTAKVIVNLQLIEDQKEYGALGYSSLFEYCVKELGYSEAQASVRVNCVRLTKKHPEIINKIESGEISPSSASLLQSFFHKNEMSAEVQKEFIVKVAKQSTRETKVMIGKSGLTKTEKTVVLSERLMRKLYKIAKMMEMEEASGELEIIEAAIDQLTEKLESEKAKRPERGSLKQRYISRSVKEHVTLRAGYQCEYVSKEGRRCSCRANLQWDHLRPVAIGGMSTKDNIQRLCFTHNQLKSRLASRP